MTCAEFLRRIDAGEPLDAGARAHAEACPSCRAALDRLEAGAATLRSWAEEPPPPFLHARLMAHLREEGARVTRRRAWWRNPAWVGSAAAVVFVAGMSAMILLRSPSITKAPLAEPSTAPPAAAVPAEEQAPDARRAGTLRERDGEEGTGLPRSAPEAARLERAPAPQPRAPRGRRDTFEAQDQPRQAPQENEGAAEPVAKKAESRFAPEPAAAERESQRGEREEARPAASRPAPQAPSVTPNVTGEALDEQTKEALRTLGYIGEDEAAPPTATQPRRARERQPAKGREKSARPVGVRCRVVPLDGGDVRLVTLSQEATPTGERPLGIAVDEEGGIRILTAAAEADASGGHLVTAVNGGRTEALRRAPLHDKPPTALSPADLEALTALSLPPGVYRIEQIP